MTTTTYMQTPRKAGFQVRFAPGTSRLLQPKCACGGPPGLTDECEDWRKKKLQRRPGNLPAPLSINHPPSSASEVPPIVHEVLRSPGQPLDSATRAFMEPRFGHNFSKVRVHTNTKAAESAEAVNALAYTVGQNVVFAERQFRPNTMDGQHLLAHELTHVIQLRSGEEITPIQPITNRPDARAEREADIASDAVMSSASGRNSSIGRTTRTTHLHKQSKLARGWEWVKEKVGADPKEEKLLEDFNQGLERSHTLCEAASYVASDPRAAERLKAASEHFEKITKGISKGLEIRDAARDIVRFVAAVKELEGVDIEKDPKRAAKAFGALFATAGNLGKRLPPGPWSGYFELLSNAADFFTNLGSQLIPGERWRERFEAAEKGEKT